MLTQEELRAKLKNPLRILITTHHKPDGDAMGSSLALYNFLIKQGHQVQVVTPTDYPEFLHWLPGNEQVMDFSADENKEKTEKLLQQVDMVFCLDFNRLSRINEMGEMVRASSALKILIDHHLDPEPFDDFRLINTKASSTCELVYEFISLMGGILLIDKDIANCLYTGIMTDTGSFRFPSTGSEVHRIVAALIDAGAENAKIHDLIFDSNSLSRLQFTGYCLKEKLEVFEEFNTALMSVSKDELNAYHIQTGDTEGLVNFALSIKGIKFAALIIERKDQVKLSLRSKNDFPVNEIAATYFNGGGHKNAAGGQTIESLADTIRKFKEILPLYKQQLSN